METIYIDAVGLTHPVIGRTMTHRWELLINELKITNSINLVHDESSDVMCVQLGYLNYLNNDRSCELQAKCLSKKTIIIYDLFNYDDCNNNDWLRISNLFPDHNIICLTVNQQLDKIIKGDNLKIIVYDILFNRTKMFYLNNNLTGSLWFYQGPEHYTFNKLSKDKSILKYFVSANQRMTSKRAAMVDFLIAQYDDCGIICCKEKNKVITGDVKSLPVGYRPLPNWVYDNSFCSVYIESTCEEENILHVTEKTFEPLIKGNFILPYSNPNFIKLLSETYGFKFPTILDYGYDTGSDRFLTYLESIKKLCSIDLTELQDYYAGNFDIIEHNRQIFIDRPYDQSIKQLLN